MEKRINKLKWDIADIAAKLNGKRTSNGFMCCCPVHKDKKQSLGIKLSDSGKLLLHCFAGCEFKDIIKAIEQVMGGKLIVIPDKRFKPTTSNWNTGKINEVWRGTVAVSKGDPVHRYLTDTRKLPLAAIPYDLRFHPELEYRQYDENQVSRYIGSFPAMVAAVRSLEGKIVTLHRTYLTEDGEKLSTKRPELDCRKLMPAASGATILGGSIRLSQANNKLVLAEGIETALAASYLSGFPAWAAWSATGLERVEVPPAVSEVYICVDNDRAGKKAARLLGERLVRNGKKVIHCKPPINTEGADWATILQKEAV